MQTILNDKRFISVEHITKGWSDDKKYRVTDKDGMKFLLKISSIPKYERCKTLFEMQKRVEKLDIPMCIPLEFGTCGEDAYILYSWVEGVDLREIHLTLPISEQYTLGLEAGRVLKKIHSIPAPDSQEDWASRFGRKADNKVKSYKGCGLRFDGDNYVLEYIESNRHLLDNRPQCLHHGDYHDGNMMYHENKLTIIDFSSYDFGDPWEEFNRIVWCAGSSPHFATGRLHGYFDGEPPLEFFQLMALYIASNTLSSIPWAVSFGQNEPDTMMKQAHEILKWFDNMQNPIPTWYFTQESRL